MSEETKEQIPATKDPMELAENHFAEEAISSEEAFHKQYAPQTMNKTSSTEEENENEEELNEDGTPKNISKKEDDDKPFEFDTAIADSDKQELDELNAKLGTDYKDLKELKSAYKQEDSKEGIKQREEDQTFIDYYKTVLDETIYPDRKIVLEDEKMKRKRNNEDISDPSIIEEMETVLQGLEESGALRFAANSLRDSVRLALKEREINAKNYDDNLIASTQKTEKETRESLQESISEVYKNGDFLGVKISKEDLINVYKDINKNKHIEHLKANPKDAIEFALYLKHKEIIQKNLGKPSFKAGVKSALEEIGITGSKQTSTIPKSNNSNSEESSLINDFLK